MFLFRSDRSHFAVAHRPVCYIGGVAESGRALCAEPIEDRKHQLRDLIAGRPDPRLQNTEWIAGEGRALFEAIRARGVEGIVAKRLGSRYVPGQRMGAWINVKVPGYAPDRRDWFNGRERQQSTVRA